MKTIFPIEKFKSIETPFYYYDMALLNATLDVIETESKKNNCHVHYAIKANANPRILKAIASRGFGADCVSGNEILAAVAAGFDASKIVFAGVGKTDKEINIGLDHNIMCFNAESKPELEVINELAAKAGKIANISLRINPNVDAHTHKKITTGLNENKFGFNLEQTSDIIAFVGTLKNLNFIGLHFHIGSQITDLSAFDDLCEVINQLQDDLEAKGFSPKNIDLGGGLGIDYNHPDENPIPSFAQYFDLFKQKLNLRPNQNLHCEPGRSVVAQCGNVITRTVFVKEGTTKKFVIVDAGMTDLIRPAMYDSFHLIENISSTGVENVYDVVGPICESSDVFGKDRKLKSTRRGDFIVLRSAGAYGEVMASEYNLRKLPKAYFSDNI